MERAPPLGVEGGQCRGCGCGRAGRPRPGDAPSSGAALTGGGGGPASRPPARPWPAFPVRIRKKLREGAHTGWGGRGHLLFLGGFLRSPRSPEVCFARPGWKRGPEGPGRGARLCPTDRAPPAPRAVGGGGCPAPGILAATLRRLAGVQASRA